MFCLGVKKQLISFLFRAESYTNPTGQNYSSFPISNLCKVWKSILAHCSPRAADVLVAAPTCLCLPAQIRSTPGSSLDLKADAGGEECYQVCFQTPIPTLNYSLHLHSTHLVHSPPAVLLLFLSFKSQEHVQPELYLVFQLKLHLKYWHNTFPAFLEVPL